MNLFYTAFRISCKHSGQRLLCLLCVFALCAGLLYGFWAAQPQQESSTAEIAVVNLDSNPLIRLALQSAASAEGLSGLFHLQFVTQEQAQQGSFTSVLTIPEGFLDSILTGENLSPTLELDISTPLEAMWVRQMLQAGADYLTTAQLGVYTVQKSVNYGIEMSAEEYQLLLADINLTIMRAMLGRLELLEQKTLFASGGLSLPQYYFTALASLLLLCYGFLFQPAIQSLWQFSRQVQHPTKRRLLLVAAVIHPCFLLCALLLAALLPLGFSAVKLTAALMLALLLGSWGGLLSLLHSKESSCAACCILLHLGCGLAGGSFLPLPLMPEIFSRIAPFLPVYQAQRLCSVLLGEPLCVAMVWQSILLAGAAFGGSLLLWKRRGS